MEHTDTKATALRLTKPFLRFCGQQGWLPVVELQRIMAMQVEGERSQGKDQLTIDESRSYLDAVRAMGGERAIAAACPLLLGLRAREILDRRVRDLDDDGHILWIRRAKTPRGNRRVMVPEELRVWLLQLAADKGPDDYLIGDGRAARSTSWLGKWVSRVCDAAKVRTVCAHGLRGTHATLAEGAGMSPELVAASLGHVTPDITGRCYTLPDARQSARQSNFLRVISGGAR